jgi:hypothetical protein
MSTDTQDMKFYRTTSQGVAVLSYKITAVRPSGREVTYYVKTLEKVVGLTRALVEGGCTSVTVSGVDDD